MYGYARNVVVTFYDSTQESWTTVQKILYYLTHVCNIIYMLCGVLLLGVLLQFSVTGRYIEPSGEVVTDYLTVTRFFYLALAIAVVDIKFSVSVGRHPWSVLSFMANILTFVVYAFATFVAAVTFWPYYNKDGNGDRNNPATNPLVCSDPNYSANPVNGCPDFGTKYVVPATDISTLQPNMEFFALFVVLGIMTLISLIRLLMSFWLPDVQSKLKSARKLANRVESVTRMNGAFDIAAAKSSTVMVPGMGVAGAQAALASGDGNMRTLSDGTIIRNEYNPGDFFQFWYKSHVVMYIIGKVLDWALTFALVIWFGWFAQDALVRVTRYEANDPNDANALEYVVYNDIANQVFYGFLATNIVFLAINELYGTMFQNIISIGGNCIALIVNLCMFIYATVNYVAYCNVDGSPFNICNDRRTYCGLYWSNPVNVVCTNTADYTAGPPLPATPAPDIDFIVLYSLIIFFVVANLYFIVTGWVFNSSFQSTKRSFKNETEKGLQAMDLNRPPAYTTMPAPYGGGLHDPAYGAGPMSRHGGHNGMMMMDQEY